MPIEEKTYTTPTGAKKRCCSNSSEGGVTEEKPLLDSGERRDFGTGATRDIQIGKGRCDLLPFGVISDLVRTYDVSVDTFTSYTGNSVTLNELVFFIFDCINDYVKSKEYNQDCILFAVNAFIFYHWGEGVLGIPNVTPKFPYKAILELSKHFEAGALKYEEDNWKKGVPMHSFLDSGIRHLLKFADNWEDEPHDRAFVWNMLCMLWTEKHFNNCSFDDETRSNIIDLKNRVF